MAITAPESTGTVTLTIDGREVTAPEGATIWQAAQAAGIDIPVLCHDERFDPVGVCRMCVVDVGAPAFAASCVRACENDMQVKTATPELERNRAMLTRLLVSDQPPRERDPKQTTTGDNELLALADRYGVTGDNTGLPCGSGRGVDGSSPVIAVDHDACILCDRCTRACDDIQGNDVIGRSGKGYATHIAFDLSDPMGASSCVSCGECVAARHAGRGAHRVAKVERDVRGVALPAAPDHVVALDVVARPGAAVAEDARVVVDRDDRAGQVDAPAGSARQAVIAADAERVGQGEQLVVAGGGLLGVALARRLVGNEQPGQHRAAALELGGAGLDLHAVLAGPHARRGERGRADVDHAHPADADRVET